MKKLFILLLSITLGSVGAETVTIQTPYSASHSGTAAMFNIIDEANRIQSDYKFTLEFRPGANQILSVRQMDSSPNNTLSIVAASIVENQELGYLSISDYAAIYSLGDACWAVITTEGKNKIESLRGATELIVGTVGFGNATHLTALEIGQKYNIPVRLIPFKSNLDAVVNMAGGNGINFGIDRFESYASLSQKNNKMQIVAASCPKRLPQLPNIPTLAEQNIQAPYVFNVVVANKSMPESKRKQLGKILDQATINLGEETVFNNSGFVPPIFYNQSAAEYFAQRVKIVQVLRNKHRHQIPARY
jgi:tripartite-type tricarboxylate transporter receptor subunit TctC